jgi:V/A-type H+-transporting ATPase subunit F
LLRVRVLANRQNAAGFGLAGLATDAYSVPSEAESLLLRAPEDPECGVLLLDEALLPALRPRTLSRLEESRLPLVIPIPMGVGAAAEKEYLERLLRRVIGYQVRLR